MASVSITGITKIKVIRLECMPNDGTWLELWDSNTDREVAWITLWIPPFQLAEQLELVALALRQSAHENRSMHITIEETKDVTGPQAEANRV